MKLQELIPVGDPFQVKGEDLANASTSVFRLEFRSFNEFACHVYGKRNNTQYVSCLLFSWALTATLTLAPAEVDDLKEATGSAEFHQFHPQAAWVSITDNQGH